jgi:signal transduction histidine kinase
MIIKNVITLKFTGIISVLLVLFSVFIFKFSNSFRETTFNERLKASTQNILFTILDSNKVSKQLVELIFRHNLNIFTKQVLVIYDEKGSVFLKSKDIEPAVDNFIKEELKLKNEINFVKSDTVYVAYNYLHKGSNFVVISSAIDEVGSLKMEALEISLITLVALGIAITIFLGRYFAEQALNPIKKVINQVEKISETNLFERVDEGNGKDEIAKLAITFNQVLDRLENSFKLQKTFVSNASHEFRTPLTVMKGQIEVLLLKPRTTETYVKTFASLLDDINNQINLINGLAGLASANANFPNTSYENINIIDLLDDCVTELAKNKKYNVILNINDILENESTLFLRGNYVLLRSALMNVMDNACKFNKNPTCNVNFNCNNEFMTITVIDQGLGISKEDISHIFESFYRSNNIRHIQGHGIGLSLVKKIVETHQGKIIATSEIGKGTKMSIYFPNINSFDNFII